MSTQPEALKPQIELKPARRSISGDAIVGFAMLGCLLAGVVGLLKALEARDLGAGGGLLASVAAFATIFWVYLRKD